MLLPSLSYISLREDRLVGDSLGQTTAAFSLPEDVALKFAARSVKIDVDVITYPETFYSSAEESWNSDSYDNQDGSDGNGI